MRIALFVVSLLYIVLEIAFRIRFLEIAGVATSNLKMIETIEVIGRSISSLGFSLLVFTYLSEKIKNKRVIKSVCSSFFAFFVFFIFQKYAVDFTAQNISNSIKERAFYLEMKKSNFYNINEYLRSIGKAVFFDKDGNKDINDKVFFINYPLSYYALEENLNPKENEIEQQIDIYVDFMFKNNSYYYNDIIYDVDKEFKKIYDMYSELQSGVEYRLSGKVLDKGVEEARNMLWTKLTIDFNDYKKTVLSTVNHYSTIDFELKSQRFISFDELVINTFSDEAWINRFLLNKAKDNRISYVNNEKDFLEFKNVVGQLILNEIISNNFGFNALKLKQKNIAHEFDKEVEKIAKSSCLALGADEFKKYRNHSLSEHGTFHIKTSKEDLVFILKNRSDVNYYCDVNESVRKGIKLLSRLQRIVNNEIYGLKFFIDSKHEFSKTSYYQKEIKKYMKYQKVNIDGYVNFKNDNFFKDVYRQTVIGRAKDKINGTLNEFLGEERFSSKNDSGIPLGLSFKGFINSDVVSSYVKKEYPFMFTGNKDHFYFSKFDNVYNSKMEEIRKEPFENMKKLTKLELKSLYKDIQNDNFDDTRLDDFAKALIVPVFVLIVSTIMIVFNVINAVLIFVKSKRVKNISKYSVIFTFFLVPFFVSNDYEQNNSQLYGKLENKNFTNWLQNTNAFIHPVEKTLGESTIIIDYMEYYYLFMFEDYKDKRVDMRRKELRKKLR